MKVNIDYSTYSSGTLVTFNFELEETDSREAISTNAGKAKVVLGATDARFFIPESIEPPHPDLCALSALKIISPYIGLRFEMDRPVSAEFADIIKKAYPSIKEVSVDPMLKARSMPSVERPVVSFSGGADSVAAAALLSLGTPLILSARTWHPKIGEFEKWYNTEANIETLARMPSRFKKISVRTDFEFLSTNGNYCIYPDSYAFTIPCLMLADHLSISHIVTGDIWVAFNGDETIFTTALTSRHNYLFESVGLSLEPILNGVGELGSLIINEHYNLSDIATSCQYGAFQKPCMKCIKCFRKSIYSWALFDKKLSPDDIKKFNLSPAIQSFAKNNERKGLSLGPSYKYAFNKINFSFDGSIGTIRNRMCSLPIEPDFVMKIFPSAYFKNRPKFTQDVFLKLIKLMDVMSNEDIKKFSELDYRKSL